MSERPTAHEIMSICRDVLTAHHERSYRAIGMLLLPAIWKYLPIEVTVMEMRNDIDVFSHVYAAWQTANGPMISRVARNGHMMRGKPKSSTSASYWRGWFRKVDNDRVVTHSAVNWKHRLDVMEGTCRDLIQCGRWVLTAKAGLAKLSV